MLFVAAAEMQSRARNKRIEALRVSTELILTTRLSRGDDAEKIESVLRESGLAFTYSEMLHSHYATVVTEMPDCHIDVALKVTEEKQLLEVRVRTVWTSS